MMGGGMMMGGGATFGFFIVSTIFALIGIAFFAFVLAFISGTFNGQNDFDKSFGAVSLASIPSYVGSLIAALPLSIISTLIAFAASIYSLVLLYRIIPLYLSVPEDKRVVHFIVSIVAAVIIWLILGVLIASILGFGIVATQAT